MTYTEPLLTLFLGLLAFSIWKSKARWSKRLLVASAIGLFLCTWPPFACLALIPFEFRYSRAPLGNADGVEAIVVLSSAVYPPSAPVPKPTLGSGTYKRTAYAAWLYNNWKPVPVLASGGGLEGEYSYAASMADFLTHQGVPEAMVWTENESKSTYENAVNSAAMLRRKNVHRIALVTEAYHMYRSELCFRRQGIEVVAAPCGFRIPDHWQSGYLLPDWEGIYWNEDVLHEVVALGWYRIKGWI